MQNLFQALLHFRVLSGLCQSLLELHVCVLSLAHDNIFQTSPPHFLAMGAAMGPSSGQMA